MIWCEVSALLACICSEYNTANSQSANVVTVSTYDVSDAVTV